MSTATDTGQVILDQISARAVLRPTLEAQDAANMLAFADLRRTEAKRHDDPRVCDSSTA